MLAARLLGRYYFYPVEGGPHASAAGRPEGLRRHALSLLLHPDPLGCIPLVIGVCVVLVLTHLHSADSRLSAKQLGVFSWAITHLYNRGGAS